MDAPHRHRSLYKGTTPPWKETFRRRCVDRLKNSRARLLDTYRQMGQGSSIVQEVMEEEWAALQSEDRRLPSLWGAQGRQEVAGFMQENDELLVLDEIQQELMSQVRIDKSSSDEKQNVFKEPKKSSCLHLNPLGSHDLTENLHQHAVIEEMSIIEECERNLQFEQQYLSSVVEDMDTVHIICPVCRMNNLSINSFFISCPCGLYINTKKQRITPDVLQRLLESSVSEHMQDCLHNPVFSVASNAESSPNLLISCKICDYLSVVL